MSGEEDKFFRDEQVDFDDSDELKQKFRERDYENNIEQPQRQISNEDNQHRNNKKKLKKARQKEKKKEKVQNDQDCWVEKNSCDQEKDRNDRNARNDRNQINQRDNRNQRNERNDKKKRRDSDRSTSNNRGDRDQRDERNRRSEKRNLSTNRSFSTQRIKRNQYIERIERNQSNHDTSNHTSDASHQLYINKKEQKDENLKNKNNLRKNNQICQYKLSCGHQCKMKNNSNLVHTHICEICQKNKRQIPQKYVEKQQQSQNCNQILHCGHKCKSESIDNCPMGFHDICEHKKFVGQKFLSHYYCINDDVSKILEQGQINQCLVKLNLQNRNIYIPKDIQDQIKLNKFQTRGSKIQTKTIRISLKK